MGTITTAFPTSYKSELFSSAHCNLANVSTTGNIISGSSVVNNVGSLAGIAVGMYVQDTGNSNVITGTTVASINSATQINLSNPANGTHPITQLAFSGDSFFIVLIQGTPNGTYGTGTVNYSDVVGNTDEVSGAGYTTGGQQLVNISPAISGTTSYITFGINPSWTSASFTTSGCVIINSKARLGGTSGTNTQGANRVIYVGSFGGSQTVTAGTFTAVLPPATSTTALLRL